MKLFKRTILTFLLAVSVGLAYGQAVVDDIGSYIGSGNVGGISRYIDNAVSLTVAGSQSTYSKSQAEMVLRDFFSKNSAKGFSREHNGGSNNCSYAIGTLTTSTGTYRAYFSFRQKDGGYVIKEIRLEK
jgi:hypothetical protein